MSIEKYCHLLGWLKLFNNYRRQPEVGITLFSTLSYSNTKFTNWIENLLNNLSNLLHICNKFDVLLVFQISCTNRINWCSSSQFIHLYICSERCWNVLFLIEWRAGLSDTILKGDQPRNIPAQSKFASI